MARGALVYLLLITCLTVIVIECRSGGKSRGGRGGGGRSRGGRGWGGGRSGGGGWFSGWFSGWFGGRRSSNTRHTYPSSKTDLSGSGTRGSGSRGSGIWGSGTRGSGTRGSGTQGSGSHSYPPHSGLSGGYGHGHPYHSQSNYHTYYSSPQYAYVHQYRNSYSQYGDLLTGLTLYNMGRSHSDHPVHYYHDDYYRSRYFSSRSSSRGGSTKSTDNPADYAACYLRVKENGKEEVLKIPCEIISTFTKSGENVTSEPVINTTLCVSNTTRTIVNNTVATTTVSTPSPVASTTLPSAIIEYPMPKATEIPPYPIMYTYTNNKNMIGDDYDIIRVGRHLVIPIDNMSSNNFTNPAMEQIFNKPIETTSTTEATATTTTKPVEITTITVSTPITSNMSEVNSTQCISTIAKDPLRIKGERLKSSKMQCSVEVHTNGHILRNHVDCNELIEVAKKPEPSADSILPPRHQLKSWLQKPPWWLSMFMTV